MSRAAVALLAALIATTALGAACRRENPAPRRTATAAAVAVANDRATAVVSTATAVVRATAEAAKPSGNRRAKVAAGNLGVAAFGISAGIQLWSRPGGVMAGGATMTGTVQDGTEVEVVSEAEFLGQKYYSIRGGGDSSRENWIEGRFLQLQ
jgi:hypothetical protein